MSDALLWARSLVRPNLRPNPLPVASRKLKSPMDETFEHLAVSRGHGKWSQRGVPHTDWRCIGVLDLGRADRVTCEMCETMAQRVSNGETR